MISWAHVPALRLALALALGIGVSGFCSGRLVLGIAIALLLGMLVLLAWPSPLRQRSITRGTAVLLLFTAVGLAGGELRSPAVPNLQAETYNFSVVRLVSPVIPKGAWLTAEAELVEGYTTAGVWERTPPARVNLSLASVFASDSLGFGSVLLTSSRIRAVRPPLNPHTFDYQAFLAAKGIGFQAYIKAGEALFLQGAEAPGLLATLRTSLSEQLDVALPTSREAAVAKALLLGDKSSLDSATRDVYTRTGAVHVLAVSGLHTGVIAGILLWVIGLSGRRLGRWPKLLLLWSGLFGYAALTGFSPSVMRSSVMFGILFAGRLLREDTNPFNSLGLSAVLLLVIDPLLLFSLGFQLSYAAVAGILAFYPYLRRVFASEYWWLNQLGQLTAVSLAATLATAPITAFHFHQFPVYFLLSGLFAVPLVTFALPCLLGALALSTICGWFGIHVYWAFLPAYLSVWLCNVSLDSISGLPFGLLEGLWPDLQTTWLLVLAVVILGMASLRRSARLTLSSASVFLFAGCSVAWSTYHRYQHWEVIAYASRGALGIDHLQGGHVSSSTFYDPNISPTRLQRLQEDRAAHQAAFGARPWRSTTDTFASAATVLTSIHVAEQHWALYTGTKRNLVPFSPTPDVVVVTNPRKATPNQLLRAFGTTPTYLIPDYLPRYRQEQFAKLSLKPWVLPEHGAYSVSLAR